MIAEPYLFPGCEPVRQAPSQDELERVLLWAARLAIAKRHRGRPPQAMDWQDLRQEVMQRALPRVRVFRYGGPKRIEEFFYMACCQALLDLQREAVRAWRAKGEETRTYPLIEYMEARAS